MTPGGGDRIMSQAHEPGQLSDPYIHGTQRSVGGVRGVLPPLEEKIFDTGCAITPMEGTVARCVLFNPIDTVASAHWV